MFSPLLVACFTAALAIASARVPSRGHGFGIIGGVPAEITELPHQVSIIVKHWGFQCGGSIISPHHILTAAQCFKVSSLRADQIEVVLGTNNRSAEDAQVFQVAKITTHENYKEIRDPFEAFLNDVAVVKLVEKITYSDTVKKISLAKPNYEVEDDTELTISGWGYRTRERIPANLPSILRKATQTIVNFEECQEIYEELNATVTEDMVCAEAEDGGAFFYGDHGGALVENTKNGKLQVGIASWFDQTDGDEAKFPDVYVRVSKYYTWIRKVVRKDLMTEAFLDIPLEDEFDF